MKQTISRLALIVLLLSSVSFGSTAALAQYRHHHRAYTPRYSHYRTGDAVIRGIHTAETVAHGAMMGYALHQADDYTGIRLGYNGATLRLGGNPDVSNDYSSGVNLGIVFGWYLGNSPVIIEPGVFYSKKGANLSGYDYDMETRYEQDVNMHMLEIPLVFKYDITYRNAGASLQPFAGAYMAFGLGGDVEDSAFRSSWKTFDEYDNFDAGFRLGCGLCVQHLYLELAYDLGLVDLADNQHFDFGETRRTNTLSVSVGFNF